MTTGQMLEYTNRFNGIIASNSSQDIKDVRLANLMTDLEAAYDIPMMRSEGFEYDNPHVMQLYRTVSEARSL